MRLLPLILRKGITNMPTPSEAIAAFATKQREYNDRLSTAINGVSTDISGMKALIDQLQNNPGPISAEDQAILDQLQAMSEDAVTRMEAVDALTPPSAPVVP